MKITMASHFFASHSGGAEIVAGELYRGWSKRGHEVVWLAGDATAPPLPIGRSRAVNLPVMNFIERRIGLPIPIPGAKAIKGIFAGIRNADVVVLHECVYLTNILVYLAARWRRTPTVIIQHAGAFPSNSRLVTILVRLATCIVTRPMLARAEQVIYISDTAREFFEGLHYRHPPEVVFNGVDTDLFRMRRGDECQATVRRSYGLPEEGTLILFVGRFVDDKGIAVMKKLSERRRDWIWVFAGWGPLDPGKWNAPNVRVLSGLRGASIAGLYRACDLLVLPSRREGFPLVIQEALASGLPVVCGEDSRRADAAMRDLVRGVPVIAGDDETTASEFIAAIEEELIRERERSGTADARRALSVSRYSWRCSIDRYLEIFSRLLPNPVATNGRIQRAVGAGGE